MMLCATFQYPGTWLRKTVRAVREAGFVKKKLFVLAQKKKSTRREDNRDRSPRHTVVAVGHMPARRRLAPCVPYNAWDVSIAACRAGAAIAHSTRRAEALRSRASRMP